MRKPFYSVGLVFRIDGEDPSFLGSGFAFLKPTRFLTAAHCIGNLRPEQLGITLPLIEHGGFCRVQNIVRHDSADLAVITIEPVEAKEGIFSFYGLGEPDWGDEVQALGYPEDADYGEEGVTPTARLFSGNIQRLYSHTSHLGYAYRAGELSFGAPAGLSGGPVFAPQEPYLVIGLVTENRKSTTYLRAVAEIQENGSVYRDSLHESIEYGLFVNLKEVWEWLHSHIFDPLDGAPSPIIRTRA